MASADGYVLPKPGIPKTLGILNVIFGVLLLLGGLCIGGMTLVAPTLLKGVEDMAKQQQAQQEAQHKELLKGLDEREKAAKSDAEKKAIEQERAAAIANKPVAPKIDMSGATDQLNDPVIMGYSYADLGIGLLLNILLLISGILLIRLSPAGKTLAITWSLLVVLSSLILTAVNIVVVQPAMKPHAEKQLAKLEADAQGKPPGSPEAAAAQWAKMMAGLGTPMAIGKAVLSMIYPAILFILLGTAGAKAALLGGKPSTPEIF